MPIFCENRKISVMMVDENVDNIFYIFIILIDEVEVGLKIFFIIFIIFIKILFL